VLEPCAVVWSRFGRWFVIGVIGAYWGCGGRSSGDTSRRGPTPIPLEDALEATIAAQCALWERCPIADSFAEIPGGCSAHQGPRLRDGWYAAVVAGVERGSIHYDAAEMARCLEHAADWTCDFLGPIPYCLGAVRGLIPVGGGCDFDEECENLGVCHGCPGRCVARRSEGAECQAGEVFCEVGMYCNGACVRAAHVNEPCDWDFTGIPCVRGAECVERSDGLSFCEPVRIAESGEDCHSSEGLCSKGLDCLPITEDDGQRVLYRCAEPYASGGSCVDGPYGDGCPVEEHCDVPRGASEPLGTCKPLPRIGESCRGNVCGPSARCSAAEVCQPLAALGESCRFDVDCFSQDCEDGRCVIWTNCWVEDREVFEQSCPTRVPRGRVFEAFDGEEAARAWVASGGELSRDAENGRSCAGALRIELAEPEPGESLVVELRAGDATSASFDLSEYSALRGFVSLVEPAQNDGGVIDSVYLRVISAEPSAGGVTETGTRWPGYWFEVIRWLEVDVSLGDLVRQKVVSIGLEVTLSAETTEGEADPLPKVTLLLDDLWLE
jgi:hypothetical protein